MSRKRVSKKSVEEKDEVPKKKNRNFDPGPIQLERKFYRVHQTVATWSKLFKTERWMGWFSFKNLEESENPEDVLTEILEYALQTGIEYAKSKGKITDRLQVVISSENLRSDIGLTIQKLNENSIDTIKNRFIDVDQSNRLRELGSLYGAPFLIDLTMLPARGTIFPPKKKMKGGKKTKNCVHNIDMDAIYDLRSNNDGYCLFRAIELLRRHEEMTRQRFHEYYQNDLQQTNDVIHLMEELNIPLNQDGYDVETYAPIIQEYYNTKFPNIFKIFFFGDVGYYEPFFTTEAAEFTTPLCIYYTDNHFIPIRNLNTFFSIRNYCFYCHKPYDRDVRHNIQCKSRCKLCCVVGHGACTIVVDYERWCDGCHKTFTNGDCYNAHLKNGACENNKYCEKCGKTYQVKDVERRSKKKDHVCFWKFCR